VGSNIENSDRSHEHVFNDALHERSAGRSPIRTE